MNDFAAVLKALARHPAQGRGTPALGDLVPLDGSASVILPNDNRLRDHVGKLLEEAGPGIAGWLLWSEELQILDGRGSCGAGNGWLLAGEIHATGEPAFGNLDRTHIIEQCGREWAVKTFVRTVVEAPQPGLLPRAFLQTRELLPWPQLKVLGGRKLRYEVAWRLIEHLGTPCYRPAVSRFVGFVDPQKNLHA